MLGRKERMFARWSVHERYPPLGQYRDDIFQGRDSLKMFSQMLAKKMLYAIDPVLFDFYLLNYSSNRTSLIDKLTSPIITDTWSKVGKRRSHADRSILTAKTTTRTTATTTTTTTMMMMMMMMMMMIIRDVRSARVLGKRSLGNS